MENKVLAEKIARVLQIQKTYEHRSPLSIREKSMLHDIQFLIHFIKGNLEMTLFERARANALKQSSEETPHAESG